MPTGRRRAPETVALMELVDETRRFFHQLKVAAQQVHDGSGLTGGLRGVLLDLFRNGDQTVPAMARARPVSRQHIQALVDELRAAGLVRLSDNPAHRRSKLVSLTKRGRDMAEQVTRRETDVLGQMELTLSADTMRSATETLRTARGLFRGADWERIVKETR